MRLIRIVDSVRDLVSFERSDTRFGLVDGLGDLVALDGFQVRFPPDQDVGLVGVVLSRLGHRLLVVLGGDGCRSDHT